MSQDGARQSAEEIVESREWLRRQIEEAASRGRPEEAAGYATRLLSRTDDEVTEVFCYRVVGTMTYQMGEVDRAREAFERAAEVVGDDATLSYALAHCAAARGHWWRALMRALEAVELADESAERAEFMRFTGVVFEALDRPDEALSVLLGALDRTPRHPWILATIGRIYENEQMWMEALGVREQLIDVLSDGLRPHARLDFEGNASESFDRLFRALAVRFDISRESLEERRRDIRRKLRAQITPASRANEGGSEDTTPLAPTELPQGLATLVEELAARERNYRLLETSQSIWAQARHEQFDVQLTPDTLAAAVHWVVERRHWRETTEMEELRQIYGVVPETIRASARLVVGRFDVTYVSEQRIRCELPPQDWKQFEKVQKALLFGVDLDDVTPSRSMVG